MACHLYNTERCLQLQLFKRPNFGVHFKQKLVREVVETLMCNYQLNWNEVAERTGVTVGALREACLYDENQLKEMAADGILDFDDNHITVYSEARSLVRCVAAALDPLMRHTDKQFSTPI